MPASQLRAIYRAIEETNVFLNGVRVPCRGLDGLDPRIPRAALPVRLLLPVSANATGRSIVLINAAGNGRNLTWSIPELALIAQVSAGKGLEEYAGVLIDYIVAHEQAVVSRRTDFQGFLVNSLAYDSGIYEFPMGSDAWYFGVKVIHSVTELV